jgi:hypothetical protein
MSHSLKDRISSHSEERDVAEIKKALATSGVDKELAASSTAGMFSCLLPRANPAHVHQVLSIVCYCAASILMTLVNKVVDVFPTPDREIDGSVVRRFRSKLFHELPPIVHPIDCLLPLRRLCKETGGHILPGFRRSRR